jgi:aspartate aminotransferase
MRVSRRAEELRALGQDIVDLSAGQPDVPSPRSAVEAVHRALDAGQTKYTAAAGLMDLRRAIAERYRQSFTVPWHAADVVVTVGAKAALFELIAVLVDDGDEAVLPSPAWVSFEEQIRFAGGTPVLVPMRAENGFRIEAAPLIAAMTEKTRLVLVNSPCNPTGGVISAGDLRQLAQACAARGAVLLCDETYECFLYDGAEHASGAAVAAELPETVVVVGSFSKTYSMTGWRLGWAAGPREIIRKAIELQSHATSNPTTFAMYGALEALRSAKPDVDAMLERFTRRRAYVVDALGRIPGVQCLPPDGAFYAFFDVSALYRPGMEGSMQLAEYLLEEAKVALVPGLAFGADAYLRLSFATSMEQLEKGLSRMAEALARLPTR